MYLVGMTSYNFVEDIFNGKKGKAPKTMHAFLDLRPSRSTITGVSHSGGCHPRGGTSLCIWWVCALNVANFDLIGTELCTKTWVFWN